MLPKVAPRIVERSCRLYLLKMIGILNRSAYITRTPFARMLTLQRYCLRGGVGRSEGVKYTQYTTIISIRIEETKKTRRRWGRHSVCAMWAWWAKEGGVWVAGRGGVSGGDEFRGLAGGKGVRGRRGRRIRPNKELWSCLSAYITRLLQIYMCIRTDINAAPKSAVVSVCSSLRISLTNRTEHTLDLLLVE